LKIEKQEKVVFEKIFDPKSKENKCKINIPE
jgi:hypothetical protein